MSYQPFLISPFKSGLQTQNAPWQMPPDAALELDNAYVKDGVLMRREGTQRLAQFVSSLGPQTNKITGIFNYVGLAVGAKQWELLFTDTTRMCRYNTVTEVCDPIDVNDIFASANYKWFSNFGITDATTQNILFIADNNEVGVPPNSPIRTYTFGAAVTSDFWPQYGSDAAKDYVLTYLMAFPLKSRLVMLNTVEDFVTPVRKPQRARWSVAHDPRDTADQWRDDIPGNGGYLDAPTSDFIIGAAALQDYLIVFFSGSTWTLKPTADPALPFRWDRINNFRACDATYSVIPHDRYVISFGRTGIVACDGIEVKRIDQNIPDFVTDTVKQDQFQEMYSATDYAMKKSWTSYNYSGDDAVATNDAILVRTEDEGAYSMFDLRLSCMGNGSSSRDFALGDFVGDYDWDFSHFDAEDFNSFFDQKDAPMFLGGGYNGWIYRLEIGASDDTPVGLDLAYSMKYMSAGLNPFRDQGKEAQLGYMDIYCDLDPSARLLVGFYQDDNPTAFKVEVINCLPDQQWQCDILDVALTNPCRVTSVGHGLNTGDKIYIYAVTGTVELNSLPFTVTRIDDNNFDLQGIDATGYTAYTGWGVVLNSPIIEQEERVWKRVYCGAVGNLHQFSIEHYGKNEHVAIHAVRPWFKPVGSRQLI